MATPQQTRDHRRFRLATNDNETVVIDDGLDTEGHRLATNDNEPTVERARRLADDGDEGGPLGMRRASTKDIDETKPLGVRYR